MITTRRVLLFFLLSTTGIISDAQETRRTQIPIGIFLGNIEEGARIFTPVRLLPFEHPEAEGHQFPNALQLYSTEPALLIWLGRQAGYGLRATLMRYPKEPSPARPYVGFSPPDTSVLHSANIVHRPAVDAELAGLRAVLFIDKKPVCFIVDTRNLSLKERGMTAPTTMGLDINRSDFVTALAKAARFVEGQRVGAVVFQ